MSGVAIECSITHCKECRTRHLLYSQLSYVVECREENALFQFPANCVREASRSCCQDHRENENCIQAESAELNMYLVYEIIYWNGALRTCISVT